MARARQSARPGAGRWANRTVRCGPGGRAATGSDRRRDAGEGSVAVVDATHGLLPNQVRGRSELVRSLHRLVEAPDGRIHVLCGMGGCGKTTVALSIAEQLDRNTPVWWISARDEPSLATGLADLAGELGITTDEMKQAAGGLQRLTDLVWRRLDATPRRWLLVIDNADAPELLAADAGRVRDGNGVVRGSSRGLVLVTSRVGDQATWGDRAVLYPIGMLAVDDGAQVLRDLAPRAGDTQEAAALAIRLGGLPLALRAAGRYLSSTDAVLDRVTTFGMFRLAVDSRFTTMLGDPTGSVGRRDVVVTTWELSLDWLAEHGLPEARAFMRLVGGFAAAPIPVDTFDRLTLSESRLFGPRGRDRRAPRRPARWVRDQLRIRLGRPVHYDEALHRQVIASLCGLGLLDITAEGRDRAIPCLVAHPLVSEVNAAQLADDPTTANEVSHMVAFLLSQAVRHRETSDADEYDRWPLLVPHLAHALSQTAGPPSRSTTVALVDAAATTSQGLNQAGSYPTAVKLDQLAVDTATRILSDEHPTTLTAKYQAATTTVNLSQLLRGADEYRAILPAITRVTGSNSTLTLRVRHNLARARAEAGFEDEALTEFRDILRRVEATVGPHCQFAVLIRNNIGDVLCWLGRYEEAEASYRIALPVVEALPGHHRDLLMTRHGLATVLSHQGRHEQAIAEFRAALATATNKLGPDHPYTLRSRGGLADALARQGKFAQAEREFQMTLAQQTEVLGPDNTITLMTQRSLAEAYARQGRHERAEAEYRHVLAAHERTLGRDHPQTIRTRNALDELQTPPTRTDHRSNGNGKADHPVDPPANPRDLAAEGVGE